MARPTTEKTRLRTNHFRQAIFGFPSSLSYSPRLPGVSCAPGKPGGMASGYYVLVLSASTRSIRRCWAIALDRSSAGMLCGGQALFVKNR